MAAPLLTATQGFFQQHPAVQLDKAKPTKKHSLVDVGGHGDRGFRAVAAGLIDSFLSNPRVKGEFLTKILGRHFACFPQHCSGAAGYFTPSEYMAQLIKQVSMPELVQTLAYTLRQLCVDELCAHPERYRRAFVNQHGNTSPEMMRKSADWTNESEIAALARALDVSIVVGTVNDGKELPKRIQYNEGSLFYTINMQLQDSHYIPVLTHAERFKTVQHQGGRTISPANNHPNDPDLADILVTIAVEDKHLLNEFDRIHNRLAAMVTAGELNKADLIALYVKGMATSESERGHTNYVGCEHGSQDFFASLLQTRASRGIVELSHHSHDAQVKNYLVDGIARTISIGQMSAKAVFALIDNKEEARSRHVPG